MAEEWLEVRGWFGEDKGLIPRTVAEALGVDCSPMDRTPQGTVFFTKEQALALRNHPRWEAGAAPDPMSPRRRLRSSR